MNVLVVWGVGFAMGMMVGFILPAYTKLTQKKTE